MSDKEARLVYFANSERCPWWLESAIRRITTQRIPRQRHNEYDDDYIARMKRTHPHLSLRDIGFIEMEDNLPTNPEQSPQADDLNKEWHPGDPCASCGSADTGWHWMEGAFCRACGRSDSDD